MGLLDWIDTPGGQGLLAAGLGALGSRTALGGISRGGLLGLQTYAGAQERQRQIAQQDKQNQMFDIQLAQAKQGQQEQADLRGLAQQFYKPPSMGMDQANAAPGQAGPSFDTTGFVNAYMAKNPIKAMQLRSSMVKELPFNKVDAKDYTPESVARFAQTQSYGDLVPRVKMDIAPNGVAYNPYGVKDGAVFNDPNKPFSLGVDGKPVANSSYQQFQVQKATAGAPRTSVVVDAAPKAFWSDFGKQASDQLFTERGIAQSAAGTLQSIGEIRKAVQGGAFSGAGADLKLGAAKAMGAIGFNIAPDAVANSEKFNAQANSFVLEKIKTLGANPSNADREFIEKTVPRLSTDPRALPDLLNFMEQKAKTQVQSYNAKIKGVQQQRGAGFMPFSLEVPEPSPAPTGAPSAAPAGGPSPEAIAAELARRGIK